MKWKVLAWVTLTLVVAVGVALIVKSQYPLYA